MTISAERLAEIRSYEPAASGFVPIHPETLRELCDRIAEQDRVIARRGELLRTACSVLESRGLFPNLCEQIEAELAGAGEE